MKCIYCGSADWAVVKQYGSLETWCCTSCGAKQLVHVNYNAPPELPGQQEAVFDIAIRWTALPSAGEIKKVRAIVPRLKMRSAIEILRAGRAGELLDVGRMTQSELIAFRGQLKYFDLEVLVSA